MRPKVDLWAKQKQMARSACMSHNRVQLWELGGCSVAQKRGLVVQKSYWDGFDMVLYATEGKLLREVQLDRPSALRQRSVDRVFSFDLKLWIIDGARKRRRFLSIVTCVLAVIRRAMTARCTSTVW